MNVHAHYQTHLARFYAWMAGNFDDKMQEQLHILHENRVLPGDGNAAIDLGCGHGIQTMALAGLGFHVTAVDFTRQLLDELRARIKGENVQVEEADVVEFLKSASSQANVITCMGDTLTHLSSVADVHSLISESYRVLTPGGKLVLSFRDMSQPLAGVDRFIPVRSEHNRIHTCFLEFFEDHVLVYDLLHEKTGDEWRQTISAYPKLRLQGGQIEDTLRQKGFRIDNMVTIQRMLYIFARKS
ncbi:MAG: class I SAM-dependent methyltransferase [Bacteroidia bacterium]|nr:class I SAM-dependent methyltransferase [Bacteroidia bacterium]